jgi:thimet oligopeptidase
MIGPLGALFWPGLFASAQISVSPAPASIPAVPFVLRVESPQLPSFDAIRADIPALGPVSRELPLREVEPESEPGEGSQALAERLVRPAGASEAFVSKTRALYASLLPAAMLRDLIDHGYVILVKHHITQDRPDLDPSNDRGGGLHDWGPKGNFIMISEFVKVDPGDRWEESLYWQNAACHEMGHAIARFLDLTKNPDFLQAWTEEHGAIPPELHRRTFPDGKANRFTYFVLPNTDGTFTIAQDETAAEGFDILIRGKDSDFNFENFSRYYPKTVSAMRKILRERYGVKDFSDPEAGEAARGPVDFALSTRKMAQAYKAAEARARASVREVLAVPARERTFANTVRALENARAELNETAWPFNFLAQVSPDRRIRRMARAISRRGGRSLADRNDILRALKEYRDKGEALSGEDQRLLAAQLSAFSGLESLDPGQSRRYDAILSRLESLRQAYLENTLEDEASMGPSEPLYAVDDPARRKDLFLRRNDIGGARNVSILSEVIRLRAELAGLLKFQSFAEYRVSRNMAGSVEKARGFLLRLKDRLQAPAREELSELLALKRREDPSAAALDPWDVEYYSHKLQKEKYSVDPEEVKEYFPVEAAVSGALGVFEDLLGLKFVETKAKAWADGVRLFEVRDSASGGRLGWFYLDLFEREGKPDSASQWSLLNGRELPGGGYREPVGAVVAGWTRGSDGKPALLTHHGLEIFFHEFGHLMHHVLTRARYALNAGASVATDFVEVPSKLMENLAWRPEVLERVSGRWDDRSKKLPEGMLKGLVSARGFQSALLTLRQVAFALTDLEYFGSPSPVDSTAVIERVFRDCGLPWPGPRRQANFSHLVNAYAAGYYGYLWAQMLAQDLFTRFLRDGALDPSAGPEFRRKILQRGSGVEEAAQVRDFLGREPDESAFLAGLGNP